VQVLASKRGEDAVGTAAGDRRHTNLARFVLLALSERRDDVGY
jgi:hypothetical protein